MVPGGAPVVRARDISVAQGGRAVLSGFSAEIRAGEWVVVSGPSGVGKTMFGDVLLGLRTPDAGLVQRAAGLSRHAFQKIYQDPVASFAPDQKLRAAMTETARLHGRRDADWLEVLVRPALLFGDEPMSRLAQ